MTRDIDFMNLSRQDILDLANPTKDYAEMIEVWPALRLDWSNHREAVSKLRVQTEVADEVDEPDPTVKETFQAFSARDGHGLKLRIFRSARAPASRGPLIVLWHGGGWILGSPTMVADMARELVKKFPGAVVIAPNYRLAPEHPWPASINDAWDSFNHIRTDSTVQALADVSTGFIIGGISAGASMALAFAHLARDERLTPKITGVYSACGSIRPREPELLEAKYRERYLSRTQEECIDNPVLSKDVAKLMFECAKPDVSSKLFAPLIWPEGDGHRNLPKIYQQLCGRDVNRDEGLIFDDILKSQGGQSRVGLYVGLPHCFWLALTHLPEFKQWKKDTLDGFEWLLED